MIRIRCRGLGLCDAACICNVTSINPAQYILALICVSSMYSKHMSVYKTT
jgi:hypothetical protein